MQYTTLEDMPLGVSFFILQQVRKVKVLYNINTYEDAVGYSELIGRVGMLGLIRSTHSRFLHHARTLSTLLAPYRNLVSGSLGMCGLDVWGLRGTINNRVNCTCCIVLLGS